MESAKKEAEELFLKYRTLHLSTWTNKEDAKKMANIAVDKILDILGKAGVYGYIDPSVSVYYEKVKRELEKL